jgi:hypothetical protein
LLNDLVHRLHKDLCLCLEESVCERAVTGAWDDPIMSVNRFPLRVWSLVTYR